MWGQQGPGGDQTWCTRRWPVAESSPGHHGLPQPQDAQPFVSSQGMQLGKKNVCRAEKTFSPIPAAGEAAGFLTFQVCCQARGTETQVPAKTQAAIHANTNGREGLIPPKSPAMKKPVPLQVCGAEMHVSPGGGRAEPPWEKPFSVIPTSSVFFFQHLFTVNYCFRLYPVLLPFSPGNCCEALEG